MKPEHYEAIKELRALGYAVVLFSPEELAGANPEQVQNVLVADAWDTIDTLSDSENEE